MARPGLWWRSAARAARRSWASVVRAGIRRWDAATGALLPAVAGGPDNTIFSVATSGLPYGRVLLAGAGNDGAVYRWDADTGQPVDPLTVIATAQATGTVAIQPLPVTTS
jgi:WD40 repeat protein